MGVQSGIPQFVRDDTFVSDGMGRRDDPFFTAAKRGQKRRIPERAPSPGKSKKILLPWSRYSVILNSGLRVKEMKTDFQAKIIEKTTWGEFVRLKIKSPEIAAKAVPGQFLMVQVSEQPYPLLRRPLSIHDRIHGTISLFFQIAGIGTKILAKKQKGEYVNIIGPLGQGFTIPQDLSGKAALAGGGRGIAPLVFLARELKSSGIDFNIYYGARALPELPLKDELKEFKLFCSTEDASYGTSGLVTSMLEKHWKEEIPAQIYACGPQAMLETVARLSRLRKIPAQLSLEARMGCGFGVCWGCVKRLKKNAREGWYKICQEGPVVDAKELAGVSSES